MTEVEYESNRPKFNFEQLRAGETLIVKQNQGCIESQKNTSIPGMPRLQVTKDRNLGVIAIDPHGQEFLRAQTGARTGATQEGMVPMGANRLNVARIHYKPEWETKEAKIHARKSEGELTMQSGDYGRATQSSLGIKLGGRRGEATIIRSRMKRDPRSEAAMPFQSGTNKLASQKHMSNPPGTGSYRKQTQDIAYGLKEEEVRKAQEFTPWFNGVNKFDSQKLTGGFGKVRDVCPHIKDLSKQFESDEKLFHSHGIIPSQSGTNKLASQRGMTNFGTPRNTTTRSAWKQEWVEAYEAAEREWKETHPFYEHTPEKSVPRELHSKAPVEATVPEEVEEEAPAAEEAPAEEEAEAEEEEEEEE